MALRVVGKHLHFRFMLNGVEYTGNTHVRALADTAPNAERNKEKAIQAEARARELVLQGHADQLRIKPMPLGKASEQFLLWCDGEFRAHPNSAKRVRGSFASIGLFFPEKMPVHSLTAGKIEDYKAWRRKCLECQNDPEKVEDCEVCEGTGLGVADVTLRHDLHSMSKFLKYCRKQSWLKSDPMQDVEIPSDKDAIRMHVLSYQEERAYFAACLQMGYTDLYDVALTMVRQGCRPGEVKALRKEDIDLVAGTLKIREGKTAAARRTLRLHPDVAHVLGARLALPSYWLFPSSRKPKDHITALHGSHNAVLAKAGLSFVLYDLRHTCATRLATKGCPLPTLAAILGHASLRMINRYVHPSSADMADAMDKYGQVPMISLEAESVRAN